METEAFKRLKTLTENMYESTGTDWLLDISIILTEPVCPTVKLTAEVDSLKHDPIEMIGNSVGEAVMLVCDEIEKRKLHIIDYVTIPIDSIEEKEQYGKTFTYVSFKEQRKRVSASLIKINDTKSEITMPKWLAKRDKFIER